VPTFLPVPSDMILTVHLHIIMRVLFPAGWGFVLFRFSVGIPLNGVVLVRTVAYRTGTCTGSLLVRTSSNFQIATNDTERRKGARTASRAMSFVVLVTFIRHSPKTSRQHHKLKLVSHKVGCQTSSNNKNNNDTWRRPQYP
jgi:hypothetical protein